MAGPFSNHVSTSHSPGPHAFHGNALINIRLGYFERIRISHLFLLSVRYGRIQELLDNPRCMKRREGEYIDRISHHLASDEIYHLSRLAWCNSYMSGCCACFHLIILTLHDWRALSAT